MKQIHLKIIKDLCKSIQIMGELECYYQLGRPSSEEAAEYIKEVWLRYVPQCQADAYRKGMEYIIRERENVRG